MRSRSSRTLTLGCAIVTVGVLLPAPGTGQVADLNREIQESQRRLEQIRVERDRLNAEVGDVRNRVRDTASELANVERRLSASRSVLAEVQFQSDLTSEQILDTQRELIMSKDQLAEHQAVLNRRLRDIYKMGPMQTIQVLIGARSFTDLLNRYRYLQHIAAFDRALVDQVRTLERDLAEQNDELQDRMRLLGSLRQERVTEVAQLQSVERERQTALRQYREREASAANRLEELGADEVQLERVIVDLEDQRRVLEARMRVASITADDAGTLEWPIDGDVIYRFGPDRRPNGTTLVWNGVGIQGRRGDPVMAVKPGRVALAGPFQGYGPTVMLSHGDGIYTLYLYLEEIGVVQGRDVQAGQVIGTVGGHETPEGPHIEFQIRAPVDGSTPKAQDPLIWLRPRGGQ